jgi:signal transduction histidine kinase
MGAINYGLPAGTSICCRECSNAVRGLVAMIPRIFLGITFFFFAMTGEASSAPKRVLLLHSFGRDFAPWNEYARTFREELTQQSPDPIDLFETSLATARTADDQEGPFVDYLRALFANRQLDLIVGIGAPAVNFIQHHRQQLFPNVPAVYTGLDQRRISFEILTPKDAVIAGKNDFSAVIDNIMQLLPATSDVDVVLGDSPIERYWLEQLRIALQPFEGRVRFNWFNKLSFEDMLKRAAVLPPRHAILFGLLSVDVAGVPHEQGKALVQLRVVSNAPIFSTTDVFFGRGIVGGPLSSVASVTRQAAAVAVRILSGEVPGSIKTPPVDYSTPKYDWRELQRWNISESRLPEGSEVYFRVPSIWEQYKIQLSVGLVVLLLQAAIISWLLLERSRRRTAEIEAGNRRREVVRLNRVVTANVLSSSIAHELNQPLGAILSNTEAAQILLKLDPPDLIQIGDILGDIVRDEQRASEIIAGLRNLLNNRNDADLKCFDLNDSVQEVVRIVAPEAAKRKITLTADCSPNALPVRSDPIHLQQVMLNLAVNGMDAMENCEIGPRSLNIRTQHNKGSGTAEVTVADSGNGIPEENLTSVFDAFFTTKPQGTGLGLPIARTIVQTYGGTIWAENRDRSTVFCFRLPLIKAD